jgi:hypothetical protein
MADLEQEGGLHNEASDHVGVKVGGRAAVLIVATLLNRHLRGR